MTAQILREIPIALTPLATALSLKDETGADLVGDGRVLRGGELARVEGETERCLDTGAEGLGVAEAEETEVVDLCLYECCVVEVGLCSDLEVDLGVCRLGVVGGSCTCLDVSVDSVVVGGRVGGEVAETVEGDCVLWCVVAGGEVVSGDLATLYVVRGLSTCEESIATDDCVCGEDGSLEEVEVLSGVDTWLLEGGGEEGGLCLLVWEERGDELELESLCDVVLELDVVSEDVGGGPGLGEVESVLLVLELCLEITVDDAGLCVAEAEDAEGDAVGCLCLYLEGGTVDVADGGWDGGMGYG